MIIHKLHLTTLLHVIDMLTAAVTEFLLSKTDTVMNKAVDIRFSLVLTCHDFFYKMSTLQPLSDSFLFAIIFFLFCCNKPAGHYL